MVQLFMNIIRPMLLKTWKPAQGGEEQDVSSDGPTSGHLDPAGEAAPYQVADVEQQEAADEHEEILCPPGPNVNFKKCIFALRVADIFPLIAAIYPKNIT
jgi:hypothetical protein